MKRVNLPRRPAGRALQVLLSAAALTLAACGNDVNVSPTEPVWPVIQPVGERNLHISGSLAAEGGSCLEATILYDGLELPGARARCADPGGCAELQLAAVTPSTTGRHTISFQVLDQSPAAVEYLAQGSVLVRRAGLALSGVRMNLGPRVANLRPGESVSFDVVFAEWTD